VRGRMYIISEYTIRLSERLSGMHRLEEEQQLLSFVLRENENQCRDRDQPKGEHDDEADLVPPFL